MMLRTRNGRINFRVVDNTVNKIIPVNLNNYLTKKQQRSLSTKPDFIWQFSQRLKQNFEAEGKSVSIFVNCFVSINGKPHERLIDSEVDMAEAQWDYFGHNNWILPRK